MSEEDDDRRSDAEKHYEHLMDDAALSRLCDGTFWDSLSAAAKSDDAWKGVAAVGGVAVCLGLGIWLKRHKQARRKTLADDEPREAVPPYVVHIGHRKVRRTVLLGAVHYALTAIQQQLALPSDVRIKDAYNKVVGHAEGGVFTVLTEEGRTRRISYNIGAGSTKDERKAGEITL